MNRSSQTVEGEHDRPARQRAGATWTRGPGEMEPGTDQPTTLLRTSVVALVSFAAVAAAVTLTEVSHGVVRTGVLVLATVLREVRSVWIRAGSVAVLLGSVWALEGVAAETTALALLWILEASAVALVLGFAPSRAGSGAGPGHRFAVTAVWLWLVVVVGALAETWVLRASGTAVGATFAHDYFILAITLATACFLAAAVAARPTLERESRAPLAKLAGPFVVIVLVLVASNVALRYWGSDDDATLRTAADTTAASMQQSVAADVDTYLARAGTAPRIPWSSMESFALTLQPVLGGNPSVSAFALVQSGGDVNTALYVLSRQGESPALGEVMGAGPQDTSAVSSVVSSGAMQLLGVRDVPSADATLAPHLVFITPQTLAKQPKAPQLLSMAVSIPVVLAEGAATLGPLQKSVVLEVRQVDPTTGESVVLASVAPEDGNVDSTSEFATSQVQIGDVTLEVRAVATELVGPSMTARVLLLSGLWAFGLVALLLVLQAANARERSQRRLEDREALLATAIAATPGLVVLVDAEGSVRMANGGTEQSADLMVGQHVGDVLPFSMTAEDRVRFSALVDMCVQGEAATLEHVDMTSEESLRIYLVNASPVPAAERDGVRALVQVQDVTEQRARAVRGAQAQRLQALGTMAGGLAHDFNNLLFIITGYLQMLEEDERIAGQQDLARYVERAVDAAGRGTEIASSLLAVSRSQPLQATEVEVGGFVRDMMPLVRQAVGGQRTVSLEVAEGRHDVLVDSGQLSSAVLNLVINSRDATASGGRVEVLVGRRDLSAGDTELAPGEYVVIEVRDDGAGMTPEVGARAFEPFFSTKSTGNGTGLGLTAVYSFATQSGGMATITTEPGRGTSVQLLMPAATHASEAAADDAAAPAGGRMRVLVVDDESALAGLVGAWVEDTGAFVRVADSPHQALVMAEELAPDVLITDIRLGDPEMDGVELAARVTALVPGVAVILMTGYSDRMAEAQMIGSRVLAKPFTKDELHDALRNLGDRVAGAPEVVR